MSLKHDFTMVVLEINVGTPEITTAVYSVCLKTHNVILCSCGKHRIKRAQKKIQYNCLIFWGAFLLPCLYISLYPSYLFRASLFYFCKYEYTSLYCVRIVTNARNTEEEEVPPEKYCWGVTDLLLLSLGLTLVKV